MPASYALGGLPIDCSSAFSSITTVEFIRAFNSITNRDDSRFYNTNQTGTDTFTNAKFRIVANSISSGALGTGLEVEIPAGTNLGSIVVQFLIFGILK